MKASPVAPVFTPKLIDFLSKRVGNYQFSKQFYMLVSQLWVQVTRPPHASGGRHD